MIFSRLFNTKNKWQAKDSNVRIAAINEELSITNSDEKAVLLTLLNTDKSELVRRAALLKLNDFDVYVSTSHDNDNASLKKFALSQVSEILTDKHDISLAIKAKEYFLQQAESKEFLTPWLEQEQEPNVVVALYNQLSQTKNAAHLFMQIFVQKQSADIQLPLLALSLPELLDTTFLTKLLKKSASDTVSAVINNTLAELLAVKERPVKLQKELQLVLSKLLALKDLADYGRYQVKHDELEAQWQQGQESIACLTTEQQTLLTQKHDKISEQLRQLFLAKAEAFQQDKIAQQLLIDKQTAQDRINQTIADINQAITTAVFEDQNLDQQVFTSQLTEIEQSISNSVLNEQEQAILKKKISSLATRLTQLPEIAQSVSDATYLISNISQLSLPQTLAELDDRQATYHDWLGQWKGVEKKAHGVLPQSIKDAHNEIKTLWRQGLKPLQTEQNKLFSQTKKKLIDVKRLLLNGKYKVCFGLFKGIQQALPLLSVQQQQQLARDFEQVSEKMSEISDWEHYIATPRKQALLAQVTSLVDAPLDNPNEQAEQVKNYRKIWNSLGHADEEIEQELNEQFNQACEQAFAPCRLFYAEQEKLRAQHLIERNALIEQAKQMVSSFESQTQQQTELDKAASFKQLDGKLNKLQQRWNQAGEVDRKDYQPLQQAFKKILVPIKTAINAFHESNSSKKQLLIQQAQQQLATDDVFQAIEKVKQLQQQWRDIGFAGSRQENKLWQAFRQVNDEIFAKREQVKSAQDNAQIQLTEQYKQTLTDIKAQLVTVSDKSTLTKARQDAEKLLSEVVNHKPVIKVVANDIESFIKSIQAQLQTISQQADKDSWQSLFTLLKVMAKADPLTTITEQADFAKLTSFWQKRLQAQLSLTILANPTERSAKTLAIEILAQVDSPIELAQQRMVVQVELMQEQMLSGADIDLNQQLVDWLTLGKLTDEDLSLLTRLQSIYIR